MPNESGLRRPGSELLASAGPSMGVAAPSRYLGLFAVMMLLIAVAGLIAALQTPRIALGINRVGDGKVRLTGPDMTVSAATPLAFAAPDVAPMRFAAETIADDTDPRIGHAANIAHWHRTARLSRMLATGRAVLSFTDAQGQTHRYPVGAAARTIGSLAAYFWLPWLTAIIAGALGLWMWTVRHRDWSSRQFALMSIGLAIAALPIAIVGETQLAVPFFRWILAANCFGTMLFGAGLMGMMMRFPTPIMSTRWASLGLLACLALTAIQGFELVARAYEAINIGCVVIFVLMLALLVAQVVAARHDAVARRAAVLIAATTATIMTIIVAVVIMPVVLGIRQPVSTAIVFPLILVVHLGVAVAVTRTRLITIGSWAGGATAMAGGTAAIVAIDLLLVSGAWALAGSAIALAAACVSAAHIGLRGAIRHRRDDRDRARDRALLNRITQLSLEIDPQHRQALWEDVLRLSFAPLDIARDLEAAGDAVPDVTVDGRSLHVPGTAATSALILSHAEHGYRRFNDADRARAAELCALLSSTNRARDDYVRGMMEERLRIARDLHDDVGARLMTSLHRGDSDGMRQDVRDAMADIRLIVGNLAGDTRCLGEVLADLRHEASVRLQAGGLVLDWSIGTGMMELADIMSGAAARHLTSIIRELMTNTLRHARATTVSVSATITPALLILTVADDGVGHDASDEGNGLGNMRRRAEALGGSIVFQSCSGFSALLTIARTACHPSREVAMPALADNG